MPVSGEILDYFKEVYESFTYYDKPVDDLVAELYHWGTDDRITKMLETFNRYLDKFQTKPFTGNISYTDADKRFSISVNLDGVSLALKGKEQILQLQVPRYGFLDPREFKKQHYRRLYKLIRAGIDSSLLENTLNNAIQPVLAELKALTKEPTEEVPGVALEEIISNS